MQISTDLALMDIPMIHHFLSTASTWAIGIPLATVERSLQHSLCFGGFDQNGKQIAFARDLYQRYGFTTPAKPEALMEINRPGIYLQ
ncbi:hypothetical protein [Undibacterium sp. Ren11W]|uniref:hypothetical protein n=1 Tax=Undibacterium sp. Ren11W TaxID=3413045 RepID=UPI003BEFC8CF